MTAKAVQVEEALQWLESRGSKRARAELETRYGIRTPKAYGCSVGDVQKLAKQVGADPALADALWVTGWHEARVLTAFIYPVERVTAAKMDWWARDFDNWGIVDTMCFKLFDQTPHAWRKVDQWTKRREEFIRRAGYVLIACLALHDKTAPDAPFMHSLKLIETGATDDRNFVMKGISWALRAVGTRNRALHTAALKTATKLAESDDASARWVGKDAVRDLSRPLVARRVAKKSKPKPR